MRLAIPFVLVACVAHHDGATGSDNPPTGCDAQDTDGDGWSDEVEDAVGTSPTDANDNPTTRGMIVFDVPYHGAPRPATQSAAVATRLARADLAIVLDTSGSMLGTDTRIQGQFQELVTMLAGTVDDLAFAAAGFGDFPVNDGANSQYDVPFYLVHRVMTAKTPAGLASLVGAMTYKNIITDGLGPWFAGMRGGDDPEQGWEALRQISTGIGISYPSPLAGTGKVPAFDPATAYPTPAPMGEQTGAIGGLGFRAGSLPIIMMVTDTTQHDDVNTQSMPVSADRDVAAKSLAGIGARVIGVNTYFGSGQADLQWIADTTGARVTPDAWGSGAARPANCAPGLCCVVADDPSNGGSAVQPAPVNGECTLMFTSDEYDTNLATMIAQAVTAVARGVRFDASATIVDDPSDAVDAVASFVDHVAAIGSGACTGATVTDSNGDGIPDTFAAVLPGTDACFEITAKPNTTVPPGGALSYHALLQPTGDGLADLAPVDIFFVVPTGECTLGGGSGSGSGIIQ